MAGVTWKCAFNGCDLDATYLAGDSAAHVLTVCDDGAECFDRKVKIDPHDANLPMLPNSRRIQVTWADEAIERAISTLEDARDGDKQIYSGSEALLVAIDGLRAILSQEAAQRTVWVAYYLDYEQSYVSEVATTREGVIEAVKANYGEPYIVDWESDDDALAGHFDAVQGKSTKHTGIWSLTEHPLYGSEA